MDISNGKVRVYNFEKSPVGFPSQKDLKGVYFEGKEDNQEYVMKRVYWDDIDIENNDIQIIKINGSLFFATASFLEEKLEKLKNSKKIIIDCKNVSFFDISAIFTLEEIIEKFKDNDLEIILVLRYRHKRKILSVDNDNVFKNIKIYSSLDDAINYTQKYELKNNG